MKFLKTNKKIIAAFAAGGILFSGITGFAVNSYLASNVQYTDNKTVAQALNELYANKKDVSELNTIKTDLSQTTATENDILNGKKAYTQNGLVTGNYTPLTTTKGTEWNNGTTTVSPGLNEINIGFDPNMITIINGATDTVYLYDSVKDANNTYVYRVTTNRKYITIKLYRNRCNMYNISWK